MEVIHLHYFLSDNENYQQSLELLVSHQRRKADFRGQDTVKRSHSQLNDRNPLGLD